MEKGKGKYLMNMGLLLALVAGLFYFMIKDHVNEVMGILNSLGTSELVALFVIAAVNILICGLIVTTLGRRYDRKYSISEGVAAHLISNMFYSITPMGIASYPSAMYVYKKQNMNTEEGISMVMTQTLLKQIFVAIACMVLSIYFISNPVTATLWGWNVNISTICIIVCGLNVIASGSLLAMCLSKKVHRVISKVIYFVIRLFVRKNNEDAMQRKFDEKIEETEAALKVILSDKVLFYKQMVLQFVKTLILYGSPYLIYLLLNKSAIFDMDTFIYWYASIMFVCYAAAVIPLPGGSVAVETFSVIVLTTSVFGNTALLTSIILLWRFFLHYGPVALGAVWMVKPIRGKTRVRSNSMITNGFEDYKK